MKINKQKRRSKPSGRRPQRRASWWVRTSAKPWTSTTMPGTRLTSDCRGGEGCGSTGAWLRTAAVLRDAAPRKWQALHHETSREWRRLHDEGTSWECTYGDWMILWVCIWRVTECTSISRGNFERHPQTLKWSPQIKCKFFGFHFKALGSQVKGLGYILRLWGSFQGFGFAIYSFGCHSRFFGLQFKVLRKLI